jgi:hypothetical protein
MLSDFRVIPNVAEGPRIFLDAGGHSGNPPNPVGFLALTRRDI